MVNNKTILKENINKGDFSKGGEVSSKLKKLLTKLGLSSEIIRRVAIVTYELEMNIIIHSEGGNIKADIKDKTVLIKASDKGPGIEDLEKALKPGYSTADSSIRQMGFGAGMGLNNVKKYSSRLDIDTEAGNNTVVKATIDF